MTVLHMQIVLGNPYLERLTLALRVDLIPARQKYLFDLHVAVPGQAGFECEFVN